MPTDFYQLIGGEKLMPHSMLMRWLMRISELYTHILSTLEGVGINSWTLRGETSGRICWDRLTRVHVNDQIGSNPDNIKGQNWDSGPHGSSKLYR